MEKLITIQKREKLNEVYIADGKGNGGANHKYIITDIDEHYSNYVTVQFQNGARKLEDSIHGIIDTDLFY